MSRAPQDWFAIVNGAAGGGRCRGRAEDLLAELDVAEVCFTESAGHASELAKRALEDGHRRFLSVGGDGTSYEVLNGLFPHEVTEPIELGLLPLGTGNSFLRDFSVESESDALARLKRGQTRAVDVVRTTHAGGVLHYMNLLTIGFISNAGDLTNRRFKRVGDKGYLAAALICAARLEHPVDPIRVDGARYGDARPASFLCFSNSQYTGGAFHVAPHADPTDGELDIVRALPMNRVRFVRNLLKAYEGKHVEDEKVEESRAKVVEFLEPRERVVMLDGEIEKLTLERLEVLPGALQVIA